MIWILRGVLALVLLAMPVAAEVAAAEVANTGQLGFLRDRAPLIDLGVGAQGTRREGAQAVARPVVAQASLFVGRAEGGIFAALPGRLDAPLRRGGSVAAGLRDLIARAEAGAAGYDAVQGGARIKPPKRPTRMTLQEIYNWIEATPGQHHAIGRYQFIPATLRHSATRLNIPASTRFGPQVQDRLADLLLGDAGLQRVEAGEMGRETFMLNLAKIWAGLPVPSGRSYYDGVAGNKAVLSYKAYAREVTRILGG